MTVKHKKAAKERLAKKPAGWMSLIAKKRHSKTSKEERSAWAKKMNEIRWKKK